MAQEDEGDEVGIGGIRVPDYLKPAYANYVSVNHTPWDFRLTFAIVKNPVPGPEREAVSGAVNPEAVADILIPANLMHGLISALQSNFDKYLDSYGPPGMEPEGPGRRE